MDFMKGLARYDTFQKSKDHLQVRTMSGATVSLLAYALMAVLFVNEIILWQTTRVEDHLVVDTTQGEHNVDITLDITFWKLACKDTQLIVEDSKGMPYDESHIRVTRAPVALGADPRIAKTLALNPNAPGLSGAMAQPGCRLTGSMRVKKVAGDFHVAAPRQLISMDGHFGYAIPPEVLSSFNATHTIHKLAFGPSFPGQVNPLSGYTPPCPDGPSMWQYHVRVVPTIYEYLYGSRTDSHQYSASDFATSQEAAQGGNMIHPGGWWKFDFSPIMVRKTETRRGIAPFLTSLCAILGGVYALSGIVDQVFYRAIEGRKAK